MEWMIILNVIIKKILVFQTVKQCAQQLARVVRAHRRKPEQQPEQAQHYRYSCQPRGQYPVEPAGSPVDLIIVGSCNALPAYLPAELMIKPAVKCFAYTVIGGQILAADLVY